MRFYVFEWLKEQGLALSTAQMLSNLVVLLIILFVAVLVHLFLHKFVLTRIQIFHQKTHGLWSQVLLDNHFFNRLAFTLQGLIVYFQVTLWLTAGSNSYDILHLCAQIWTIVYGLLSIFSLLDAILMIARDRPLAKNLPLRGIFQSIKLILAILVGILIISILIGRSPIVLLSGLGAMTAVLMLVFKEPIMGLVAGIQLSVNNMLNVGDWLEMPKYEADGEVIDIGLTTVKVQNWDKTISMIPTSALISDSFKNWRGMVESGGRRIKRSFNVDTNSIHFLTEDEYDALKRANLIRPYVESKTEEINHYNQSLEFDLSSPLNGRRMTNIGTFRAYLIAYLRSHPGIHQEMTLMVRQLAPTVSGLPIEIYAFTNTVVWAQYEGIQADIFDHIYAVVHEFGLVIHQTPTGNDMKILAKHSD